MTDIKTEQSLLITLCQAATRELSAKIIHDQRVSFGMNSLSENSNATRAFVEAQVARQEGNKTV